MGAFARGNEKSCRRRKSFLFPFLREFSPLSVVVQSEVSIMGVMIVKVWKGLVGRV